MTKVFGGKIAKISWSRSPRAAFFDEVHNGRLVVERKRAPLPDGSLQQLVSHSINKQVHRHDHGRTPPVLSLSKPTKRKETIERQTFEERCCELGVTRETGLRLLQDSKREDNSQDFWGASKTEPASERRLETEGPKSLGTNRCRIATESGVRDTLESPRLQDP